jgi:hypothetical protein
MKTLLLTTCLLSISQPLWAQEARKVEDREARRLIREFDKAMKPKKASLGSRITAVKNLGLYSNGLFVKPLLRTARSDKAKSVRQVAIIAIGNQPTRPARSALNMLLKKTSITSDPNVTAAIVKAFDQGSYQSKDYKTFKGLFDRSLADQRCVAAQIAILELFGHQKEVQAAQYLSMHIDAPAPAWVDDASNPPASYWEARWKNWSKWRNQLKEALFQITGQRFASNKESRAWLKKNRNKLKKGKARSSKKK